MDHDSGTLLSMEHGDKRQVICCYIVVRDIMLQVNLKYTNLEAHLFKKVLSGLLDRGVPIQEIVTDAHVQIISILSKFPCATYLYHISCLKIVHVKPHSNYL